VEVATIVGVCNLYRLILCLQPVSVDVGVCKLVLVGFGVQVKLQEPLYIGDLNSQQGLKDYSQDSLPMVPAE
jgi:hypothetical protein